MNLSGLFVRRPIGTILLAIGVLLLGVAAYLRLPVAPLPQLDLPFIFVSASEPGASPQVMAATVAAPLEHRLGSIPGITEMTSTSSNGNSTIVMQFDLSRDVNGAARDVQAAINAAAPDLPAGMPSPPTYHKANPADQPVIILALTSHSLPVSELYSLGDSLVGQDIRQLSGVAEVDVAGGADPSIRVAVNPAALASMGLSIDDVRNALAQATDNAPKGLISGPNHQYMISADDQLLTAAEFRKVIIGQKGGKPIRLTDVATVSKGQENDQQAAWLNGQRAVLIMVRKQADANVIKTADAVKTLLPRLQHWLPPAAHIQVVADRTQTIRASVNEVQIALLASLALVVLVIFLFLRRGMPTLIAGVTVPLALAATFGVMWLAGYSLDNLSLMALTISVGFVVDDAIVVIENVARHLEAGETRLQAALNGAREIGFTILSMSLSLVAVFIPLLFMGGVIGYFFREFSVTLAIAIFASMIVSLTLTPALAGMLMRAEDHAASQPRWAQALEAGFGRLLGAYRIGLDWALRHGRLMLLVTLGTVALTFWLYGQVPTGLFPQQDTGQMFGSVRASPSISFDAMSAKLEAAMKIVGHDPAVQNVAAFTGGSGFGHASNSGRMYVSLKPIAQRKVSIDKVINRLRPQFNRIIGAQVFLQPVQDLRVGGRLTNASYSYSLRGDSLDELYQWAPKLVARMKQMPQFEDVNSDLEKAGPQAEVTIDRDRASRLRVPIASIDSVLNDAFSQRQVAVLYDQSNAYRVVLVVDPKFQQSPEDFNQIFVKNTSGQTLPLSAVAHLSYGSAPLQVKHEGQFPVVNVSYNLAPGVTLGQATAAINQAMLDLHMPGDIRGGGAGNARLFASSMSSEPYLLAGALLTIYIVLGMLYESLIHPITILSTLPSAGLGALLALLLFHSELDVVSIIGIVLLMGIVKKNAILMIDFALHAERSRGLTTEQAIYEAALVRFRPIIMTSLAAMFGALPLAIGFGVGSELRVPLGIAIVGGLLVSQFLTLFTTPVIYLWFDRLSRRRKARRERRRQARIAAASG